MKKVETRVVYWRTFRGCKIAMPERLSQSTAPYGLFVACRFNKTAVVTVDRMKNVWLDFKP